MMAHADQVARVPLAAAMDAHGLHSQVRRGAQLADRRVHARRHGLTLGTLVRGRLRGRGRGREVRIGLGRGRVRGRGRGRGRGRVGARVEG